MQHLKPAYWSSFSSICGTWFAWASTEMPAWVSTFSLARLALACVTSTSRMLLSADWRFWLVVVMVEATLAKRLARAPSVALSLESC